MKKILLLTILICTTNNGFADVQTPEFLLPNGVDSTQIVNPYTGESGNVRKGTIGAALANTHTLNQLLQNPPSAENEKQIKNIIAQHKKQLSSLKIIGVFNLFSINEWLANSEKQPGRCLLGLLYLQQYPKEITHNTKIIINKLRQTSKNNYLQKAIDALPN